MAKSERVSTLTLHPRERVGTTGANAVRHAGQIPGVLFGHGSSVPIAVDARALSNLLTSGGQSRIVDATLGGTQESVLLREVQRDPVTHRPLTADFQRVSLTEKISASVRIHTVGVARGVKDFGGIMDVVTHELLIYGPAGKIPEHLEVDVTGLGIGEHITAGNVQIPDEFELETPAETTVVAIELPRAEVEAAATAAEGAAATPAAEAPAAEAQT
jgi:large subunit ribosomal protein L25